MSAPVDRQEVSEWMARLDAIHALTQRRLALELDVADVAARAGMAAGTLEHLERRGTDVPLSVLQRWAHAVGLEVRVTLLPHPRGAAS